jgi:hypothetical protein
MQVFYNRSGAVKYAIARHYIGRENNKPQFEYHQQSIDYIHSKLRELPTDNTEVGHVGQAINVDLEKAEVNPELRTVAGPKGFEPLTFSLEG